MIRLKHILTELSEDETTRLIDKINQKQFKFFDKGDNGLVKEILSLGVDGTNPMLIPVIKKLLRMEKTCI